MRQTHYEEEYITDLSKKDLELAYALVFLGEEQSSAENHIWGAHIKEKYDQQTARRIYTKMLISHVESVLFELRSWVLEYADSNPEEFSQAELVLLAEKTYDISDKGEAEERPYLGQIGKNLKFAFRCFAKAFDLKFKPDYGGDGWQAFRQAVKIRNRITHPKTPASMSIKDDELAAMYKALCWFLDTYHNLLGEFKGSLNPALMKRLIEYQSCDSP